MAILHVRNVPEPLYKDIKRLAEDGKRSFNSEVVHLLGSAVHEEQAVYNSRRAFSAILKRGRKRKSEPGMPDSPALLREDRDR